jgi:peptidoglycan/xylan/chitin deacetylase (PgdA/CDA1 family)
MWTKLVSQLKKLNQQKALILMYHQVNQRKSDPWDLAVHPDRFETQLNFLKNNFEVLPMDELVTKVNSRTLGKNSIAVTFDDGFHDNYQNAVPLLDWYKIPATFYFPTNPLRSERQFWWEELETIILHSQTLPDSLFINIAGEDFFFRLKLHRNLTSRSMQDISGWRYGTSFTNERIDLYLKLWKKIQPLRHSQQEEIMRELRFWSSFRSSAPATTRIMNEHQLQNISNNNLFSIGAHTVNHSMLGAQSSADQFYEISQSKETLEKLLRKKISGFAYPYGNFTDVTRKLVDQAGYRYAVSTHEDAVIDGIDLFSLPRIQVKNWCVSEFAFNLKTRLQ